MYLVVTRMPGTVTAGDLGLCCYVPCLSSAIISTLLVDYFVRAVRTKARQVDEFAHVLTREELKLSLIHI